MKPAIHPTWYPDAVVTCACGNTWTTGSTKKEIHTDVCNNCHPFFTGEQRIVDTAGQVERFMKRIGAKDQIAAAQPVEGKASKKEKRRSRRAAATEPVAPEAPSELPLADMAPVAPAGIVGDVASMDTVIEPTETPRGTESTAIGGTAEVSDRVADVEKTEGAKARAPRKPRASGPRKSAKPKAEEPKIEEPKAEAPKTEE